MNIAYNLYNIDIVQCQIYAKLMFLIPIFLSCSTCDVTPNAPVLFIRRSQFILIWKLKKGTLIQKEWLFRHEYAYSVFY